MARSLHDCDVSGVDVACGIDDFLFSTVVNLVVGMVV